jgi:hypothetical protein
MPWYFLSGLYLVIWSALLIHCLMRRQFYSVFGRGWGTKVFWLLTFVFFNPLLTFQYFVFGFLLRPVKVRESGEDLKFPATGGALAAIAFVGFVLVLYEWPFAGYHAEPVVIRSESQEPGPQEPNESFGGLKEGPNRRTWLLGNQVSLPAIGQGRLAMGKARNGAQTFGSTSAQSGASASVRNIMLICQNRHRLFDRVARQLQKSLVRLPDVDQVAYYPYGSRPEPGAILPDVFITVDTLDFVETAFLRSRRLKAIIRWKVGSTLFEDPIRRNPRADMKDTASGGAAAVFHAESRLDHESTVVGIEGPLAKYKLEEDGISAEMIKSISKQFASLLDKYGRLPKAPQTLYGTYREPPAFSFLADHGAEQLVSGHGLLKNNHTVWRFAEKGTADEALTAYRDELKASGWDCQEQNKDYLWMRRQNEHVSIFQEHRRDAGAGALDGGRANPSAAGASGALMIAQYTSDFTDEQIQQAMDALLAGETDVRTLLAFERYFTPDQLERLRTIVEAAPAYTLDGSLMLGRYWAARGQMDKGRQCLMRARALLFAEKETDLKSQEIRSLAKKLADESLADAPMSEETLRDVGFVNAGQLTEPLKAEKGPDELVLLYRRLGSGQFHAFALRVTRSRDASSSAPYVLLVTESREGRSISSETAGSYRPGDVWAAEFTLHSPAAEGKSTKLTVKSVGIQRFLFVVGP